MGERRIRHRSRRPLSAEEKAEFDRTASRAEQEAAEIEADARRFFDEHARLREVIALLKEERERQGISLNRMAETAEMDPANLHRLENDEHANPTLVTVERIAHALGKQIKVTIVDSAA